MQGRITVIDFLLEYKNIQKCLLKEVVVVG